MGGPMGGGPMGGGPMGGSPMGGGPMGGGPMGGGPMGGGGMRGSMTGSNGNLYGMGSGVQAQAQQGGYDPFNSLTGLSSGNTSKPNSFGQQQSPAQGRRNSNY